MNINHNLIFTDGKEKWIERDFTGISLERKFSASNYTFGSANDNTAFRVYVYNFTTPLNIAIAFAQHPKINVWGLITSTISGIFTRGYFG